MKEKKIALSGLVFAVVAAGTIFADTTDSKVENAHAFYLGPDIFYAFEKSSDEWAKEKSHGVYGGLRARYDFLLPSAWYVGFDGLYSWGKERYKITGELLSDTIRTSSEANLAQAEARLGYNFQPWSRFIFTPFAGIGGYWINSKSSVVFDDEFEVNDIFIKARWAYYALGARTRFVVTPSFDFGLNAKAMRSFGERLSTKHHDSIHKTHPDSKMWGYEISMPLTWHITEKKKWDVQVEPYFLKLNTKSDGQIIGGRFLIGYRF